MKRFTLLSALMLFIPALAQPASAAVRVFACEPEWGALAREIGGDEVSVFTATHALQDPHHIQARPSLIARMRRADLVIATGAQLEIGWLPVLLRQAANPRVQPGQPGYLAAADYVQKLDVPARVDRALGDIHPAGNPHIQTDPRNIGRVAAALAERLQQIDPQHAAAYAARYANFARRWQQALARWPRPDRARAASASHEPRRTGSRHSRARAGRRHPGAGHPCADGHPGAATRHRVH